MDQADLIDSLEHYRFVALGSIFFSVVLFGLIAVGTLMFCASSPADCGKAIAAILAIPLVQAVCLFISWNLLERRRHLPVSAVLMFLSGFPPFVPLLWWLIAAFRHHR
jgi:hypothetical protein